MQTNLINRIEASANVDFGNILSKSFELFKKVWMEGFVHVLISMVVVIPFVLLVYIPLLPMYMDALQDPYYYEPEMDLSVIQIVGYVILVLVMALIMQVISIVIAAHFMRVCKKADIGTSEDIGGYFVYLKGNFGKLFMLSLATLGISILAALLCYLPIFYVMVPLQLLIPIFAFNKNLSVSEMLNAAFKLGNKFWLIVFGLMIIGGLIAQLGILACGIGVLFTAYFAHIPIYYFYKDSVGFDDQKELID